MTIEGIADDEFGRGVRHSASFIRAFDQSQAGWDFTADRETVRILAGALDSLADHRAQRLASGREEGVRVCSCGVGADQEDDHDDDCTIWRKA